MDISFELYRVFYYAAVSESFSRAAEKLYISQSAVSQSIKALEQQTGQKLFYRKSRNIKLTYEGELLFKHVEQAYNYIKTGEHKLEQLKGLDLGEVRIGAGDTICKYFLIPFFKDFTHLHPGIKIHVVNRTSSQISSLLKQGQIDMGIVTLPISDSSIEVKPFTAVRDVFVAGDRFSSLKGRKIPLKELFSHPLLLLTSNSSTRRNLDSLLEKAGISPSPELELESIELLVEFARIGMGIAHVLENSAASAIGSGELFEVETSEALPERLLGIATIKDIPLSRATEEFIDFIAGS